MSSVAEGAHRGRGVRYLERVVRAPRRYRLALLMVLCGMVAGLEAGVAREVFGLTGSVDIAPQASALWPYGTFHDLRWVLVYHHNPWQFVGYSVSAIVLRSVFCTVLVLLSWPRSSAVPPLRKLLVHNLVFATVIGAVLSPWAALSIVVAEVSLTYYLFGELLPLVFLAPFLQRGGMLVHWWRGLPPAGTVGIAVLNFITLTGSSAVVAMVPDGMTVAAAGLAGTVNGLLWEQAVRVAHREPHARHWRHVPLAPIAFAVVAVVMFGVGNIAQLGTERAAKSRPPELAMLEDQVSREPVIFLAGYDSQYDGGSGEVDPPIVRYSYEGLNRDGRPRAYRQVDTHQSLVTSAHRLAEQVTKLHQRTGKDVSLLAVSEGTLVARYYLTILPHPHVDMLAMLSPILRGGRIYFPPPHTDTGWGVVTGWQLRGMFAAFGIAPQLPNNADEPFIRSFVDNAPLFRGKQMLCPIEGVRVVAFVPTFDAAANPPGQTPEIPMVEVPGLHGLLLTNSETRRRVAAFLEHGQVRREGRWDYMALQNAGAAWQSPALHLQLNRRWSNVAGHSTRNYDPDHCWLK